MTTMKVLKFGTIEDTQRAKEVLALLQGTERKEGKPTPFHFRSEGLHQVKVSGTPDAIAKVEKILKGAKMHSGLVAVNDHVERMGTSRALTPEEWDKRDSLEQDRFDAGMGRSYRGPTRY